MTFPHPQLIKLRFSVRGGLLALAVLFASLSATRLVATAQEAGTGVYEVELTAAPLKWEIQPGLAVDGWGYNGQVPGPELRVREGELVRVKLKNQLPVPTTIHWHGIDVPTNMDGVPGISQPPVEPGAEFLYEFVATNPGTRWYHSHVASNSQMELGLYGAIIVEPREPEETRYDREFTYLLDERALDFTPDVALGNAQVRNRDAGNGRGGLFDYDLFLINGKAGDAIPPLAIADGERIRLRLVNAGNLPHAMHLHGMSFTIIATDGNVVPPAARLVKDTVLIGPGERYDLEIRGTNPGVWMFHCHMPNHSDNGMMTALVFDGFTLPNAAHQQHTPPIVAAPSPVATAATLPSATPRTPTVATELAVRVIDDRFVPSPLLVPVGSSVVWSNAGTNLHTATAFDNRFESGTLLAGQSFRYTFTERGEYRYYCRQHLLGGMLGTIRVE